MEIVSGHFEPILGKVPAVVVAVLAGDEVEVHALGTLAGEPDPASLCWEVGSITKVFTGLLLAEMSISGEVRLDDPVGRYLPDPVARRLPALAQQPTLADLATHTAGLARLPWPIIRRGLRSSDPYAGLSESLVLGCLGPGTKRPRRDRIRYSNFGMGLLGHLLGLASGRPYETLVGERILSPLEMASTSVGGCGPGARPVPGFRRGKPTPPWTFGALAGAGALRSTATDLITFARACINPPDNTVGEALVLSRRKRHKGPFPGGAVGLGWMLMDKGGRHTSWHNGGTYGSSSFLGIDPTRGVAVVALGNSGPRLIPPLDRPSWALLDGLRA
jgi:D-alanyl-D-alanine-carboxypeptidase/D-alanyl-D-alanine-endopeptidase